MGNESEKDLQRQQTNTSDQSRKNPSQQSGQNQGQQDPSKKNPSQGGSSRQGDDQEDFNQEKRRAS
jgi:hypothetical protein